MRLGGGQEELGEELLDVVLEPGDLLYMPKGTVHQAEAPEVRGGAPVQGLKG